MPVSNKKKYYNRVRRTCLLWNIEIVFIGEHKNYRRVELRVVKGKPLQTTSQLLVSQTGEASSPLNINWKKCHKELTDYGVVGAVKEKRNLQV